MKEQISMIYIPKSERTDLYKRRWENAFQRWSDKYGMQIDRTESYGCCGYGIMCDWCTDNSYGRPCVRALNAMCREKGWLIDYTNRNFEEVWTGERKDNG